MKVDASLIISESGKRGGFYDQTHPQETLYLRIASILFRAWGSYYRAWEICEVHVFSNVNENYLGHNGYFLFFYFCHFLNLLYGIAVNTVIPPLLFVNKWLHDAKEGTLFIPESWFKNNDNKHKQK